MSRFGQSFWIASFIGPLSLGLGAMGCAHTPPPAEGQTALSQDILTQHFATHPISATRLGVHRHDHEMPRFDASAREARLRRLESDLRNLRQLPATTDQGEAYDRRILEYALESERLELHEVRGWQRNPMHYVGVLSGGAASLVDGTFAPVEVRMGALTARLGQFSRVIGEARQNLDDVPRLWTEFAIKSGRGAVSFLRDDVPAALRAQGMEGVDPTTKKNFDQALAKAVLDVEGFVKWLQDDLLPRSKGDPRLGAKLFEKKLRFDEHFDLDVATLETMNEAAITRYKAWVEKTAAKIDPEASAADVMNRVTEVHPDASALLPTADKYVTEARDFVVAKQIVTLPTEALPIVRESPKYMRRGFASMAHPGPFERDGVEAYYNVTNVDPEWSAEKQHQHLTYFNYPGLLGISVHEAMPGHFVQLGYMRRIESDVRKVFSTASFIEGWAHYTEQMMVDEGLGDGDPKIRLGQLRRALQRHARWAAALDVHVHGKSVEEAAKRFESIAYFAPFPALRETQRATYNPTYLYYALGRMEILAIRAELEKKQGSQFSLRDFHDRLLTLGLPLPLAREALLK